MPPKPKFRSMTNDGHNDGAKLSNTIPQIRHASSSLLPDPAAQYCTGMPPQTRFKSMTNFMQNESVSMPATISQSKSTLGPLSGMPSQTRFKSMTNIIQNESVSIPATISQRRCALGPLTGMPHQTKFKSMPNFVQNENVLAPSTLSQNRNTLSSLPDNLPQTRSKRVMNVMHDDTTLVPTTILQEGREPCPPVVKRRCLPTQKSASRAEILEEGLLDNGANEQEFPPSVGVDERLSNDIHESNSSNIQASSTSISKVRKTRGPTQMTAFQPPQGMKWTCMFIRGQPIGEPSSKLAGTLGLYARNESYFSPYKKWKQQSMQSFNDVMKEIMVHFEFVNQEGMPANMEDVNKFCFRSLQIKLKEWRCELKKKGYMKGENEELSVEPPEQRITQTTWDSLVQYWGTDEKVQECERNQRNRAHELATHTLGAKSIARHNQEQREKLGDSYTTLGAYINAHQTKSGDYPNEHTRSICEKVIEACQEKDLMSSSEPAILSPILDGVCNGHHGGYERGCGLGWSRMSRWGDIGNQASNENIKQLTLELKNAKAEIEAMHAREKEREEAMQAREREMQERMERMEAMFTIHFSNSSVGDSR